MLPLLNLSLHDAPTGPKATKPKAPFVKPYENKQKLTDLQRKYLEERWVDDTWKLELETPETPSPPAGRVLWNRVKSSDSDWAELQRAKAVARRKHPVAPYPTPSAGSDAFEPEPFVFAPPPPDPSSVDFEQLKALTGELSFGDVRARLNAADPQWASKPTSEKDAIVQAMKVTIRTERLQKQIAEHFERRATAEAEHTAKQEAAEAAHNQKQVVLKSQKAGAGVLLSAEATPKQQARALLRIHFQKKGVDGKMRYWSKTPPPGRSQTPSVPKELDSARQQWASKQITLMLSTNTNPLEFLLNLPFPPLELYLGGADVVPSDHPNKPTVVAKTGTIPAFAGPILGVGSASQPSGSSVFFYVKRRELSFKTAPPEFAPIGDDFGVLDAGKRAASTKALTETYSDFLDALVAFGATEKDLFGDTNELLEYTAVSGRFNRTLRVPADLVMPFLPPPESMGSATALTTQESFNNIRRLYQAIKNSNTPKGPEHASFETFQNESLRRIHSLWRVMALTPVLPMHIPVLRSVKNRVFLPHGLAGLSDDEVKPGMAFLDNAFVSTAMTGVEGYFGSQLAAFFDQATNCCLMSLNVSSGTPAVPLFLAGSKLSHWPKEQEIVLPPLCTYVYRDRRLVTVGLRTLTLYHFDVYPSFD